MLIVVEPHDSRLALRTCLWKVAFNSGAEIVSRPSRKTKLSAMRLFAFATEDESRMFDSPSRQELGLCENSVRDDFLRARSWRCVFVVVIDFCALLPPTRQDSNSGLFFIRCLLVFHRKHVSTVVPPPAESVAMLSLWFIVASITFIVMCSRLPAPKISRSTFHTFVVRGSNCWVETHSRGSSTWEVEHFSAGDGC